MFGGYTSRSWISSKVNHSEFVVDKQAYVFSADLQRSYNARNHGEAVFHSLKNGPWFKNAICINGEPMNGPNKAYRSVKDSVYGTYPDSNGIDPFLGTHINKSKNEKVENR